MLRLLYVAISWWLKYSDRTASGLRLNFVWHSRQFLFAAATPVFLAFFCVFVKGYTKVHFEEELRFLKHNKARLMDSYNFTNTDIPIAPSDSTLFLLLSGLKDHVSALLTSAPASDGIADTSLSPKIQVKSNVTATASTTAAAADSVTTFPTTDTIATTQNSRKENEAMTIYEDIKLLHRDIDRIELELTSIYLELLYKRQERAFLKNKNVLPHNNDQGDKQS